MEDITNTTVPDQPATVETIPTPQGRGLTAPVFHVDESPFLPTAENFKQTIPYTFELDSPFDYNKETVFMPSALRSDTAKAVADIPKAGLINTQSGKDWVSAVNLGDEYTVYANGLESTVKREGAMFEQSVASEQGPLLASAPNFKTADTTKFTGERARMRIRQGLKLGVIFNIPLWHSGFWIRIKAPGEGEILELYRQLTADKITLGRASYGLLFSNHTSYASKALLDFCVDNMYESSLAIKDGDNIRKYIKTADLPILFWGLACSIYPNGFQYTRGCISDPEKCNHVIKEKLDLSKLLWTDTNSLTKYQVNHMTKRGRGSMDTDSLKRYQDEFIRGQKKLIKLNDQVSITVKMPTAVEHIDSGYRWVSAIEETYGKALIQDAKERDNYLISQGKSTLMRQYGHFIESITVDEDTYDDIETIEGVLDDLTASDELRDSFMEKVEKYLDDSIISLIAIPTYKCPNCGGDQVSHKDRPRHPNLIPLDVVQTFFTLVISLYRRIEAR